MVYTDRTRFTTGLQRCQMRRYYAFHAEGTGLSPAGASLPLWVGSLIHELLQIVLQAHVGASGCVDRDLYRGRVQEAIEHALGDPDGPGEDYTHKEQVALAEGLVWGWVRLVLPVLLADYEIVCVEQEMPLEVADWLVLNTRPDFIARRRSDGQLGYHEFKSAKYFGDSDIQEYVSAPQMMAGTLAAEKHFGEPVTHYMIHALIKGGRAYFTNRRGGKSAQERQYSPFCYLKVAIPPNPPLSDTWVVESSGFWLDKIPSWETGITPEELAEAMDLGTLRELYLTVGPYPRQDKAVELFLTTLLAEESVWQGRLGGIKQAEITYGEPELSQIKTAIIPRSFKCFDFGSRCPYYGPCILGEPTEGKYLPREPHHRED